MTWRAWEHLTTEDLSAPPPTAVAILPVAAVEQHGPHLPLGTDAILTDAVLAAAAARGVERAQVLRLPTQRVGLSPEHESFPGTLSVSPQTIIDQWTAIGSGVANAGITKLVILNGHGGQTGLVDVVATGLRRAHAMSVARVTTFRLIESQEDRQRLAALGLDDRELRYGLHGGMVETSMMLAVAPSLVRSDRVDGFRSAAQDLEPGFGALEVEGATGLAWLAEDLNPSGATGDAGAASPELGHRILDLMASRLVAILEDLAGMPALGVPSSSGDPA